MSLIKRFSSILFTIIFFSGCFCKTEGVMKEPFSQANMEEFLENALNSNDYDLVGSLIDAGADVNFVYKGESLLYFFSKMKKTELAIKAIEKGADVNWISPEDNETSLCWAIYNNDLKLVDKLLEMDIDNDYKDSHGQSYFAKCLFLERYECLDILLSHSQMKNNIMNSDSSWYFLIYYWKERTPSIIHKIYGNNIVIPDEIPVLITAIDENNLDAVKFFIDLGIDKNKTYYDERTREYITPLEKAYQMEFFLHHSPSSDFKYSEDDPVILSIRTIIELLSNSMIISPETGDNSLEHFQS